jgi:hypothetical protein
LVVPEKNTLFLKVIIIQTVSSEANLSCFVISSSS